MRENVAEDSKSTAGWLRRYRISLSIFLLGLVVSGLTAFPLLAELRVLANSLGIEDPGAYENLTGLRHWIGFVLTGLETSYAQFPFLGYGTDWLAFGHLALAVLIAGALKEPQRRSWVIRYAIGLCIAVIPTAFIAGSIRGIPVYWRLIDCSFGVLGAVPLLYCLHCLRALQNGSEERSAFN